VPTTLAQCVVGTWRLSDSKIYKGLDGPGPDPVHYVAGLKQRSYGVSGKGTVTYQDYEEDGTATATGFLWQFETQTGQVQFDYGISAGKLIHTVTNYSGSTRIIRNGTQFGSPSQLQYEFNEGAETITSCTATTLALVATAWSETYTRT
jgi:hypothetical protein